MGPTEVEKVLNVMEAMGDLERAVADFYRACSAKWPEDRPFWSNLVDEEIRHAEFIGTMSARLRANPRLFETGRPFSLSAIRTVIDGIKGNRLKVERGEVSRKQVLFLSLDMEKSILESKYQDILKTTDHEYLQMIREITLQTNSHHRQIANRVERLQD